MTCELRGSPANRKATLRQRSRADESASANWNIIVDAKTKVEVGRNMWSARSWLSPPSKMATEIARSSFRVSFDHPELYDWAFAMRKSPTNRLRILAYRKYHLTSESTCGSHHRCDQSFRNVAIHTRSASYPSVRVDFAVESSASSLRLLSTLSVSMLKEHQNAPRIDTAHTRRR